MSEGQQNYLSQVNRKRLLTIGASIAAVVVLLIVILIVALTPTKSSPTGKCQLVDKRPVINMDRIHPIPSQDNRALVGFAGYMVFRHENPKSDKRKYLEFKLQDVQHLPQQGERRLIKLHTDCATIDMQVETFYGPKYKFYKIASYSIELNSETDLEICYAKTDLEFLSNQFFECHREQLYVCQRGQSVTNGTVTSKLGTKLVKDVINIPMLDLELDGDPQSIKSGRFDLNPAIC